MRNKKALLIVGAVVLVLGLIGLIVKAKFFSKPAPGALSISTSPKAVVFLDGNQVGMTPFLNDKIEAGEHMVKLVPESADENLVSWEAKVTLASNILTVINRNLGITESESSGETIYLEKIGSRDKSSLAVVSAPSQSVIKIDGEPKGFAPILVEELAAGDYQVSVASPGFEERSVSVKTVSGYKLIVDVQLAQKIEGIAEATASAEEEEGEVAGEITDEDDEVDEDDETTPTPKATSTPKAEVTPPEKPYIKVKETPTGFLRVRGEPSIQTGKEVAKINPGEMYSYLEEEENGWYKIEYEKGEEGWVSGTYAELIQ